MPMRLIRLLPHTNWRFRLPACRARFCLMLWKEVVAPRENEIEGSSSDIWLAMKLVQG
jgi:hypothetical protein